MANFRYFCDIDGAGIELAQIQPMDNSKFAGLYPGVAGFRYDGYMKYVGVAAGGADRRILPVTRKIEYKANPSLHACNAKCMNGKCNGVCECRCGGQNHGRGTFSQPKSARPA